VVTRPGLLRSCATLAALVGIAAPGRAEDAPPCLASVTLDPGSAVIGQQVLYRLRVLSRDEVAAVEWVEPLAFPGFRAERLAGPPQPARVERGDASYRVHEEHRALFPERSGTFALRGAGLRCRVGGESNRFFLAPVPVATLTVFAPPEAGRPPGFAGLVGPLAMHAVVEPRAVTLGESVRLAVMLRGSGNLWDAPDPLALAGADAELFRHRPVRRLEPGSRLLVRVHFVYDLVPRRAGTLLVPSIEVPYFDAETRRYEVASAPAVAVTVAAAAPDAAGEGASDAAAGAAIGRDAEPPGTGGGSWLAVGLGLVAGATVAFAWVRRRHRGGASAGALAAADAARDRGDRDGEAAALARALREALADGVPGARSLAAEEILERVAAPAAAWAARLLAEVDRARFDPSATPPDRDAVERALGELRG
jgi:hypothetical protein